MNKLKKLSRFELGYFTLEFLVDDSGIPMMMLYPAGTENLFSLRRENIDALSSIKPLAEVFNTSFPAYQAENLVQLKITGDPASSGYAGGTTMRNSASTTGLRFFSQQNTVKSGDTIISTELEDSRGIRAIHTVVHRAGAPYIITRTEIINGSPETIGVELMTSFSLGGISQYQPDEGSGKYIIHRFRSTWSAEGRHEALPAEQLNLERPWQGHGVRSLRFGQTGSMPVKDFFPFTAIEDSQYKVLWGAQIAVAGSWQMEVSRTTDMLNLSGGLADREKGHWVKNLQVGESFCSPDAVISCCTGNIHDLCYMLQQYQLDFSFPPESEMDLPLIFNDWCTSWGNPDYSSILELADSLKDSGVRYLVMDDGWFNDDRGGQKAVGDWTASIKKFPGGLKYLTNEIRKRGLVPGIWFEFECCTEGSALFEKTEHLLHLDGKILQAGNRRFLDFRDPWVNEYLHEKVIRMLKENNFGYLKTDYNDTIGLGCDGSDSPGEGLRAHLSAVQNFYRLIKNEIPGIVIEICSSGGHRLEPSWITLGDMGGFSDSHEGVDIPIIAANTQMMIPASKNQIWAVLRTDDSAQRLFYSLSAAMLGRMCLSGDLISLSSIQRAIVMKAVYFYRQVAHIIRDGISYREGKRQLSYLNPEGFQLVSRELQEHNERMIIIHTFNNSPPVLTVELKSGEKLKDVFAAEGIQLAVSGHLLVISGIEDFTGIVLHMG